MITILMNRFTKDLIQIAATTFAVTAAQGLAERIFGPRHYVIDNDGQMPMDGEMPYSEHSLNIEGNSLTIQNNDNVTINLHMAPDMLSGLQNLPFFISDEEDEEYQEEDDDEDEDDE